MQKTVKILYSKMFYPQSMITYREQLAIVSSVIVVFTAAILLISFKLISGIALCIFDMIISFDLNKGPKNSNNFPLMKDDIFNPRIL